MNYSTHYLNYAIDVADIWRYERASYLSHNKDNRSKDWITALQDSLHPFFFKCPPLILASDKSDYAERYRRNYFELKDQSCPSDFFIHKGNVYDMDESVEVKLNDTNLLFFQELFILKLHQYFDGLSYLKSFLTHQLGSNFENDLENFEEFLNTSLIQYSQIIDDRIKIIIKEWFDDNIKNNETQDEIIQTPASIDGAISNINIQDQSAEISVNVPIESLDPPEGYIPIPGKFSNAQILQYFSFLFLEKDKEGNTFLKKVEVQEMFKYGLAIPPIPLEYKYHLSCSPQFPKGIVEFCIYTFFSKHTTSHNKRLILQFFACYIADFEKALDNAKAMETWSDNVGKRRPKRMKFALVTYLPED